MRRVYFTNSAVPYGYGYTCEQVAELPDDLAEKLCFRGVCVEIQKDFEPLPSDFPYRDAFITSGLVTLSQLESMPKSHCLSELNSISWAFPLTHKVLYDYREKKNKKPPKKTIIY